MTRTKCNLLAILFLASAAVASCAVKAETSEEFNARLDRERLTTVLKLCDVQSENARQIMSMRQEGYGMSQILSGVNQEYLDNRFVKRVQTAYKEPLYRNQGAQERAIHEFGIHVQVQCLEENLPKD